MTEPQGGSDPTRFETRARRDGDEWVIDGWKFFSSNARTSSFLIVMAVTDPDVSAYQGMSMFLVPTDTPGVKIVRNIGLMGEHFGDGHEGMHALIHYDEVRVPAESLLGGEGQAFAIAQTRLGGGRIHHAMRTVGVCQKALDMMCERALSRQTQGSLLADKQSVQNYIADSYAQLMQFRLFVLYVAWEIDQYQDYRKVRHDIAAVKVLTAQVLHDIVQRSIQVHGALGVSNELPLGGYWMMVPVMGLVDGPSEVHRVTVARQILKRYKAAPGRVADRAPAREAGRGAPEVRRAPRARGRQPVTPEATAPDDSVVDDEERTRGLVDLERLRAFFDEHGLPGAGEPLEATFVTGGASNELFEIRRGGHRMALRRPPRIVPEGRNETMLREYRLLAALADTDVPHARALAVCDDPELMGGCFYVMEFVDGWSPMGGGRLARPVRHRPRGPARPGLPTRRRHRQAGQGRLARRAASRASAVPTASTSARSTGG